MCVAAAAVIIPVGAISSTTNAGGFSLASVVSSIKMFYGDGELTGGNGTSYSGNTVDSSGAVVDSDDAAGYLTVKEEDYNVKYAVRIWGINHDTYSTDNGKTTDTAGLTFGPATGESYVSSYEAHLTESEFESGDSGVCLHWMTWEEIIIQSQIDPTAFQECLENGCTHSVELDLNDTIGSGSTYAMSNGDGAGMLCYSIEEEYRNWDVIMDTGLAYTWAASRIRATLNGKDSSTDSTYAGTDTLTTANCLLSCFPDELRDAIVAKEVTGFSDSDKTTTLTSYDDLWLFAWTELSSSGNSAWSVEGEVYPLLTSSSAPSLISCNEGGVTNVWWTRTMGPDYSSSIVVQVTTSGGMGVISYDTVSTAVGIAPGFCIP